MRLAVAAMAFLLTSSLTAVWAQEARSWYQSDEWDSFNRVTRQIANSGHALVDEAGRGRTVGAEAVIFVRQNEMGILTGDSHICHTSASPVRVSIQPDGGRVVDTRAVAVSDHRRSVFLNNAAQQAILSARTDIKVETRDLCGTVIEMTFSANNLEAIISHVRPPRAASPANRR